MKTSEIVYGLCTSPKGDLFIWFAYENTFLLSNEQEDDDPELINEYEHGKFIEQAFAAKGVQLQVGIENGADGCSMECRVLSPKDKKVVDQVARDLGFRVNADYQRSVSGE